MANNKTCKQCRWYAEAWEQADGSKMTCEQLGYKRTAKSCKEWAEKLPAKNVNIAELQVPDYESLFENVLVDEGFKIQLALDIVVRRVKQECADNGFDVDIDDRAFKAIANKIIGLRQILFLIRGLGMARYEEVWMNELIKTSFATKDKK